MNSPSPSGAKDVIVTAILHFHTMASTFEEDDSAAVSDRDFFRPLRGSGGVGADFPTAYEAVKELKKGKNISRRGAMTPSPQR
ncbi:MAG: hypothetical protein P4N24_15065 [Acidobacteriota bacterium]|nr:hypothetical protein [Acidobacteriota bacterium]